MNIYYRNNRRAIVKISSFTVTFLFILTFIGGFLFGTYYETSEKIKEDTENIDVEVNKDSIIDQDSIKSFMFSLNLKHKDVVYAQILLETDRFKSNIFKNNHNLFGMKLASSRPRISNKLNLKHIKYEDSITLYGWQLSLLDYALYQSKYGKGKSKEEYIDHLSKNYAEDPKYGDKIKQLIKIEKL